ncbi:MAG TPA: hypothetical protein VKZ55_04245 [Microthrixaceae bacterium]|nr:hypothetical protein [Microthrixaceae bacterium]
MKRRTLDILFSVGGTVLAVLLLVIGLVLQGEANFADEYVREQLGSQRITFTPEENLTDEEREAECLVENAGQLLETGKQAECYANEYIGLHLTQTNDGKTYAETSGEARAAAAEAEEAREAGAPNADELEARAEELSGKVETLFRGETLRGLLLTSYGFSIFGERAAQAALVAFAAAAVLLLASIAGFIHAFRTPESEIVT